MFFCLPFRNVWLADQGDSQELLFLSFILTAVALQTMTVFLAVSYGENRGRHPVAVSMLLSDLNYLSNCQNLKVYTQNLKVYTCGHVSPVCLCTCSLQASQNEK